MNSFDLQLRLKEIKRADKEQLTAILATLAKIWPLGDNQIIALRAAHIKMMTKFNSNSESIETLLAFPRRTT